MNEYHYKKLCIVHYVGNLVINTLVGRNLKYSILRTQHKGVPSSIPKISGPNVSNRSINSMNYKGISNHLTLTSNPIFMNADVYSYHPEQRDSIKENMYNMMRGGANAQLYSSNIYEKLINQTIAKYKSLGYTISPDDLSFLQKLINDMKQNELEILDIYSDIINVFRYRELLNNPSYASKISDEDKKEFEQLLKNGEFEKIKEKKKRLDEILKKEQNLTFTARQSLEIMYPIMKDFRIFAERQDKFNQEQREFNQKILNKINNQPLEDYDMAKGTA